jgi:hypothetical protein
MTAPQKQKNRRQTIIDTLFFTLALSTLAAVTSRPPLVADPDIWLHLLTGKLIAANRAVPYIDTFSAHAAGRPWIAYSWLFDVLVHAVYSVSGYRGLLALTTCVATATTGLTALFLSRFMNLRRALILAFLEYLVLVPLKSPRPWLFTILFFTIELFLLWIARERGRPAWLLPIVPLFVLWANLHIQFVYGLGLIGLFALDASVPASIRAKISAEPSPALRGRWFWVLLTASCMSTLLNPYGWKLYTMVVEYATQAAPLAYIEEFQAMPFRSIWNWLAILLIGSAVFVLGRSKSLVLISSLAAGCFFGFRSQRDIWFPVAVSLLALASEMRKGSPEFARSRCIYAIAIPLSLLISVSTLTVGDEFSEQALSKGIAEHFPVQASTFIESQHLQSPFFNSYHWGDYLIFRFPKITVSIDGRTDLSNDYLPRAVNTLTGKGNWSLDPDLKKARTIILERDGALASILRVDSRYRLIYEDNTASVFEPVR